MPESSPLMMMSSSGFFLRRFRHQIYWVQLLDGVVSDAVSDASKKKKAVASAKRGVQALMNIKNGLDDPHSVLNWDADAVDPCSWTMITFSPDKFIIGCRFALVQSKNKGCQENGNKTQTRGQILLSNFERRFRNTKRLMKISPDWFRFCYLRLLLMVVVWLSWPFRPLDNPKGFLSLNGDVFSGIVTQDRFDFSIFEILGFLSPAIPTSDLLGSTSRTGKGFHFWLVAFPLMHLVKLVNYGTAHCMTGKQWKKIDFHGGYAI